MADRLESMAILLAVIDAGGFSAASRRLDIPLTTVSRRVSELEHHLNARLLKRSSRKLTLTDAGRTYVAACRRILDEVDEAERAAAGEYRAPRGTLVVTAPIVFGRLHVLPIVVELLRAEPEVDVRLVLTDGLVDLVGERVDVAVRIGELPTSSLVARRVGAVRQVVCGSPGYFARRGIPRSPEELVAHECITFEGLASADTWRFGAESKLSTTVRSRLVVNTAEAAIDAAAAGLGIARALSYQIAGAMATDHLALCLEDFEPTPWPVSLVHSGQRPLPAKVRAFLDQAAPRLAARLAASL